MSEQKLTETHGSGSVRRLQTRTTIYAPIQTVWHSLTRIEHVRRWWADGAIGSAAGEPFQLGGEEDLNGTIVTMCEPHIFSFTWQDQPEQASHPEWIETTTNGLVHFDLIETAAEATLLTLIQFAPLAGASGAAAGWHQLIEQLVAYTERGLTPSASGERFEALKRLYAEG